jgi:hypothetical protein
MAKYVVIIMTRKSNAASSKDGEIKKLDKDYKKKGVEIKIAPNELQLVFANGPNKEVEDWTAKHLRKRMQEKGLVNDWRPAGER